MSKESLIWDIKKDPLMKLINSGKREDGRQFDEYREITVQNNYIPEKAEGSCYVQIGKTKVIAGVKMDVMKPYPDAPEEGVMMTGAELVPMADPIYYAGPPNEDSIEFARVVDRGIRESKSIDVGKLCIESGEKVWAVLLDLHVFDYDGNLFDTATIAAMNALWNAKLPKYEDNKIIREEFSGKLPMKEKPISATFVKIGNGNIIDPSLNEEKIMDARMVMAISEKDHLCAAQKSGIGIYSRQEIDQMLDTAILKTRENRKYIKIE